MKHCNILVVLLALLFSFTGARFGHAEVLLEHYSYANNGALEEAEEAIVAVSVPIDIVKRELTTLLLDEESPIKEVSRLDFDAISRLMILEGVIEIPTDLLADLEDAAGNRRVQHRHRFKVVLSFPTVQMLSLTSWLQITIHRFELSGQDYSSAFPVLGRFLGLILSNRSFANYLLDIDESVEVSEDDVSIRIRQFIERKNIRFRDNTISFRLNLKEFADLRRFAELTELRLWQFGPALLRGTQNPVFRIEAGIGRPHSNWLTNTRARGQQEARTLEEARQEYYSRLSDIQPVMNDLRKNLVDLRDQLDLKTLEDRDERELSEFLSHSESRLRSSLSLENPEFRADPVVAADEIRKDANERLISFITDLKRRVLIARHVQAGGRQGNGRPFLEKRLSQRVIDQAVRYFRDVDFEGEKLFSELNVVIAPHLPGLILRGRVNLDLNMIFAMAMEGTGVETGDIPIRASSEQWGAGIPFQVALRTVMFDDGWLGLDIRSMSLFTGLQRLTITQDSPHGGFLVNFIKMTITQTLVTTLIEQPFASTGVEGEDFNFYENILDNINRQRESYLSALRDVQRRGDIDRLVELTKLDIETNPFLATGREFVEGKTELFFKDLIVYDEADGLIKFRLDPRVVSDSILSSENTVQVWNVEPLYDETHDQTYLELALGDSVRSRSYLERLRTRPENQASQNFVGSRGEETDADVRAKLDLSSFTSLVTHVLNDAAKEQAEEAEAAIARDQESEHYIVQDLTLRAVGQNRLHLGAILTLIEKKKRGALNPRRWFGETFDVTRRSVAIDSEIVVEVVPLERYRRSIQRFQDEVFLGDTLLKVDLRSAQVRMGGQIGLVDRMINLVGNVNFDRSALATKVKVLVLRVVSRALNPADPKKNGNVELGGVRLNRYAKVFTHGEEILLQIHPHILASAFDVRFRQVDETSDLMSRSLFVNPADQTISFDFSTVGNMASVDKAELLSVMSETKNLFLPVLALNDPEALKRELTRLTLFDRALYNSDMAKPSLRHRFLRILSFYEGLLDAAHPDLTTVNHINRSLGITQGFSDSLSDGRQITTCGVELMYFVATAMVMRSKIEGLISKIREFGLENDVPYYNEFVKAADDLRDRFMIPFAELYERKFHDRNQSILRRGPTDWTHTYYPDALYSDSIYQEVKETLNRVKENR
jgi:hypothetical protein